MTSFKEWQKFLTIVEFVTGAGTLTEANWPVEQDQKVINNPAFQQWLQSLGVTEPLSEPKDGGVGRAYFAGDYVIKFTMDRNEADSAAVVKGYDSPNLSKVFDVKTVSFHTDQFGKRQPMFAIVQQKVNTDVSKRHRIAGQAIYDYLDFNPGFLKANVSDLLPAVVSRLPRKYQQDQITVRLVQQLLSKIKKIQDDTGFLTQDTHGANIGFKGREPAFFDLGRSSIDFDNPATAGARVGSL